MTYNSIMVGITVMNFIAIIFKWPHEFGYAMLGVIVGMIMGRIIGRREAEAKEKGIAPLS